MPSQRYEDLCQYVLQKSKGKAAMIVVVDGPLGRGAVVQENFSFAGGKFHLRKLPKMLREIADEIDKKLE